MPDKDLGPVVIDLTAQPKLDGDLELQHGIIGAIDPKSVALKLAPGVAFDGKIELIKLGYDYENSFTLASASVPVSDPPVITGASAALSLKVKVDAEFKDKMLNLGGELSFTPRAQLTLGGSSISLQDASTAPVFTLCCLNLAESNPKFNFDVIITTVRFNFCQQFPKVLVVRQFHT